MALPCRFGFRPGIPRADAAPANPHTGLVSSTNLGPCHKALLLDMDGTLVDTEPLWEKAQAALAGELGVQFSPEARAATIGTPASGWLPEWLVSVGLPSDDHSVAKAALHIEDQVISGVSDGLQMKEGALGLLEQCARMAVPCVLVSASPRRLVDAVLSRLDPAPFAASVSGDDVERSKPHPEPYVKAAALVGQDPRHTLAVEDSLTGGRSASRAGCSA